MLQNQQRIFNTTHSKFQKREEGGDSFSHAQMLPFSLHSSSTLLVEIFRLLLFCRQQQYIQQAAALLSDISCQQRHTENFRQRRLALAQHRPAILLETCQEQKSDRKNPNLLVPAKKICSMATVRCILSNSSPTTIRYGGSR
jgi:hypothetical protein